MVFLNQLGTGSASQPPKHSFITELRNISAALENLGTYLSLATVRSQKLASEHDHFQKMSLVDGLTGVGNRRAFDDKLHSLWLHAWGTSFLQKRFAAGSTCPRQHQV